ncbi:hypothetical protein [Actinomadura rugatobispora]|uniref:Uncharacterized protein n=1 Tax=Actinomadura rugatobispora TaxID=1994 RepID=A0ABW1A4E4_9ACTN|nr:hypothetical protein GCM10010200_062870 [Actinomadura rugatobispora]
MSEPAENDTATPPPETTFQVRIKATWRDSGQLIAMLVLVVASAGFVGSGLIRGAGTGSAVFVVLGALGLVVFGAGLLGAFGKLLGRRPLLELTDEGVRRPARWPMPRSGDRLLPWSRVTAMAAVRRGMAGTRRGEQDFLVFLPSGELLEMARTAERPQLIALTLPDVPATAEAAAWCFEVERGWDVPLKEVVVQARRRHEIPVVDRRKK